MRAPPPRGLRELTCASAFVVALALGAGVATAAPPKRVAADDGEVADAAPPPARVPPTPKLDGKSLRTGSDVTRCAACHRAEGWAQVRFNHDPTGFPLRGAHAAVTCGACHPKSFDVPVADTCAGCHRDRHAGEFGAFCEGCHDDASWRPFFQADAHRRTAFPLVGKHALIPCQQCHGNMRDRSFVGAAVGCVSCHRAAYDQTRVGFSLECQTCHGTWRFWPARLQQHGACFRIASGSHHGIRCLGCHSSLPSVTFTGACATGTFTCAGCHEHACARSDAQHANVMGYQCTDPKCYECHTLKGQ